MFPVSSHPHLFLISHPTYHRSIDKLEVILRDAETPQDRIERDIMADTMDPPTQLNQAGTTGVEEEEVDMVDMVMVEMAAEEAEEVGE